MVKEVVVKEVGGGSVLRVKRSVYIEGVPHLGSVAVGQGLVERVDVATVRVGTTRVSAQVCIEDFKQVRLVIVGPRFSGSAGDDRAIVEEVYVSLWPPLIAGAT